MANRQADNKPCFLVSIEILVPAAKMKKDTAYEDRCVCHSHSRDGQYLDKLRINVRSFSGDKIKNNEMGGTCSTYGREERRIQDFGGES
jgi:hypothetical protein